MVSSPQELHLVPGPGLRGEGVPIFVYFCCKYLSPNNSILHKPFEIFGYFLLSCAMIPDRALG